MVETQTVEDDLKHLKVLVSKDITMVAMVANIMVEVYKKLLFQIV